LSSRIRVLHVLGTGERHAIGIARTALHLAQRLPSSRWKFSVLFIRDGGPLSERFEEAGLETYEAGWHGGLTDFKGARRFAGAVRDIAPHIVHFHAGGRAQRLAARTAGRPRIIAHYHSIYEESGGGGARTGAVADVVLANSHATAATIPRAKPVVVHQGIATGPIIRRRSVNTRIGVAARLAPVKGISTLVEAMSIVLRDHPALTSTTFLEIAGTGPEEAALRAQISDHGLERQVRLHGWRENVRHLMQRWDIYVQPSIAEGFGISVLEAMAVGLPVIASRTGGLPELVEDGHNGILTEPGDAQGLADAIVSLAADEEMRRRLGAAGRERVAREFTIEGEVGSIAAVYEQLLS
jgi:glycosyltransferase involved in cell wall biosynthesis